MKIFIAAILALFVTGTAFAQTPTSRDAVKDAPKDTPIAKERDAMPKTNSNALQSGGAMNDDAPKKK